LEDFGMHCTSRVPRAVSAQGTTQAGPSGRSCLDGADRCHDPRTPMNDTLWPDVVNVLDWVGTLVFALSGGLVGVRKQFDLFGVLFLSFVVSVAGGIMRDVLIGAVPP